MVTARARRSAGGTAGGDGRARFDQLLTLRRRRRTDSGRPGRGGVACGAKRVLWRVLLWGRARAELWLRAGARLQLLRDAIQGPPASDASLREAHGDAVHSRLSCFLVSYCH